MIGRNRQKMVGKIVNFCLKLNRIKLLGFEAKHKNLKPSRLTINDKSDEWLQGIIIIV